MKILLLAIRSLMRFRLYTAINILGLALSLICVIILSRYMYQEVMTDRFIENLDRLYITTIQNRDNPEVRFSGSDNTGKESHFKDPLLDPAVEKSTKFATYMDNQVRYNEQTYTTNFFVVDTCFLKLLPYPLLAGNPATLFRKPESAAITQAFARKLFGKENPLGKKIMLSIGKEVTIEGIIGEPSTQSSFLFDLLVSTTLQNNWSRMPQTIALFHPDAKLSEVNKRVGKFMNLKAWRGDVRYQFFPMNQLYFNTSVKQYSLYTPGNFANIQVLFIVTLLILLVGLFNFINIYTVLTLKRGREFGMKKVFGSARIQLFAQLYIENLCQTGLALLIGWTCIELTNTIVESALDISQKSGNRFDLLFSFGLLFLLPLVSSLYPYIKYNYAKPITSLRSVNAGGYSILSRRIFLIVQYVISISLIILSIFFIKQLNFMLNTDPGFRTADIIRLKFLQRNHTLDDNYQTAEAKREKLKEQAEIISHRMNESPLFQQWINGECPYEYEEGIRFKKEGSEFQPVYHYYDSNNQEFDFYQFQIIEGRGWDETIDDWGQYKAIINESAMKLFGIKDIEKERLQPEDRLWWSSNIPGMDTNPPYEIIGVVKDFQIGHLSKATPPVIMTYGKPGNWFQKMNALCMPGKRQECIQFLHQLYTEVIGGEFSYSFIEDDLQQIYKEDKKITTVYTIFALIAILISSLGLFGLSLFDVQQRYREIAIRKVNGATTLVVMQMLLRKYYKLLGIAFVIATPIAWLAIHKYLENFAHKAAISWWIFAIALLITAAISLVTLVWQIRRAAQTNPAKAIKNE